MANIEEVYSEDPFDDVIEFEPNEEEVNEGSNELDEGTSEESVEPSIEEGAESDSEVDKEAGEDDSSEADSNGEKATEQSGEKDVEEEKKEDEEEVAEVDVVKIDGKEVEFPKEDIYKAGKEHLAGKVVWDKKFSELDKNKKAYEAELNEVNGYINEFGAKMKDNDILGAFEYFGNFANVPAYEIKEQLIASLLPEIQRRSSLTDSELQVEMLQSKNEHLISVKESDEKRIAEEQAVKELQSGIEGIRETHNIEEEVWKTTEDFIKSNLEDGQEITPELIKNTIINERLYSKAELLLGEISEEVAKDETWNETLFDIMEKNPDFTEDDLRYIVKEWSEKMEVENTKSKLADKIQKQNNVTVSKKTVIDNNNNDDIDPELEDWI